jgi:hypothetical protein
MKSFLLILEIKAEAGTHKIHVNAPQTEKPVIIFRHGNTGNLHYSVKTLDVNKISLQDKTIYRYPKLVLPRNKVDVLKEKYNLSVVRTPDTADYKIISSDYIDSLLERKWTDTVMFDAFVEYYKKTINHWDTASTERAIEYIKSIREGDEKIAISIKSNMSWSFHNTTAYDITREIPSVEDKASYISDEETLKSILAAKNLIFDTVLCGVTVEDSIILGETEYNNLVTMINSNDTDNINLVLEMMANSNVEKSFDIIALLFYMHHHTLKDRSSNWTSVNVKTLRKRFNNFIPYGNLNVHYYDRLLKNLIEENFLTEFAFKVVSVKMLEHLVTSVGFNQESVFDIKLEDVKLKAQFQERMMKKNDLGIDVITKETSYLPF